MFSFFETSIKKILHSTHLFSDPGFSKGMARIVDLFGQLDEYNYKETKQEADYEALKRDWHVVGQDLSQSIQDYDKAENQEEPDKNFSTL